MIQLTVYFNNILKKSLAPNVATLHGFTSSIPISITGIGQQLEHVFLVNRCESIYYKACGRVGVSGTIWYNEVCLQYMIS